MGSVMLPVVAMVVLVAVVWLFNCLNILREYERAVVFRLGRVLKTKKGRASSSSSGRSTTS